MTFTERVTDERARLTPADTKVLDVLLADPVTAAFLRAEEVCERAGTHPASATRLAQRLRYDGYPELRVALREEFVQQPDPSERIRRHIERADPQDILLAHVQSQISALQQVAHHVDQSRLDDVADRLRIANRVFLFGRGNAAVLSEMMDRRLRRYGIDTVDLDGPGRDIAERIHNLCTDDVVLVFAFRRPPGLLTQVLEFAAQRGAATVLLTDSLRATQPAPTVLLAAPRGDSGDFQTLTVPMAIANALVLTIATKAPEQSLSSLDRLAPVLDLFDP